MTNVSWSDQTFCVYTVLLAPETIRLPMTQGRTRPFCELILIVPNTGLPHTGASPRRITGTSPVTRLVSPLGNNDVKVCGCEGSWIVIPLSKGVNHAAVVSCNTGSVSLIVKSKTGNKLSGYCGATKIRSLEAPLATSLLS